MKMQVPPFLRWVWRTASAPRSPGLLSVSGLLAAVPAALLVRLLLAAGLVVGAAGGRAYAQLDDDDLNGDGVLNAPYRGPVSDWREANLDMAYGEVRNLRLYQVNGATRVQLSGTWDRSLIRVYEGFDASGVEIKPGEFVPDGRLVDDTRDHWRISIKAVAAPNSIASSAQDVTFGLRNSIDPQCTSTFALIEDELDPHCCEGFCLNEEEGWCLDYICEEYCLAACGCDNECPDDPVQTTSLNIQVAPTATASGVEGHSWYPGTPILYVRSGMAELAVTVNESATMIGQSFLNAPAFDTYLEDVSFDVRLPGMPETAFLPPSSLFSTGAGSSKINIGTPWPGHLPGWWVQGAGTAGDPYDAIAPDGAIHRFSETPALGASAPTHFLERIIPAGVNPDAPEAFITYTYTSYGNEKFVTRISDSQGYYIDLHRDDSVPGAGRVTSIETSDGRVWIIDTDGNGWIQKITPPGGKGARWFAHDPDGKLRGIRRGDGVTVLYDFQYVSSGEYAGEIETESLNDGSGLVPYGSYLHGANARTQIMHPDGIAANDRTVRCNYNGGYLQSIELAGSITQLNWNIDSPRGTVALQRTELPGGPGTTAAVVVQRSYEEQFPFVEKVALQPAAPLITYNVDLEYQSGTQYFRLPRIRKSWDGVGNETNFQYNGSITAFHQLERVLGPTEQRGLSPAGSVTEYVYYPEDVPQGGLLQDIRVKVSPSEWRVTRHEYDDARRLIQVTEDWGGKNLISKNADVLTPLRADGQPVRTTTPRDYQTLHDYHSDLSGRVERIRQFVASGVSTGNSYDTLYGYDSEGWLETVDTPIKDQDGTAIPGEGTHRLHYTRDRLGRILVTREGKASGSGVDPAVLDAQGTVYNRIGEIVKTVSLNGLYERFVFDQRGQLIQQLYGYDDTIGSSTDGPAYPDMTVTHVYDDAGRLDRTVHGSGIQLDYSQNRDSYGRALKIMEEPEGSVTHLQYDSNSRVTRQEVRSGSSLFSWVTTNYDELGRPFRMLEGGEVPSVPPSITLYGYRLDGLPSIVLKKGAHPCTGTNNGSDDPAQNVSLLPHAGDHYTSYAYDTAGRMDGMLTSGDAVSCPAGVAEEIAYTLTLDNDGNVLQTAANGFTFVRQFDALNRLTSETPPSGARVDIRYDTLSNPIEQWRYDTAARQPSPALLHRKYNYDELGRLQEHIQIDDTSPNLPDRPRLPDATTVLDYHASGDGAARLERITNPVNHSTEYAIDHAQLSASTTDPVQRVSTRTRDGFGRFSRLQVDEPLLDAGVRSRSTTLDYQDSMGRQINILRNDQSAEPVELHRDAVGNLTSLVDRRGVTNSWEPDHFGRPRRSLEAQGSLDRLTETLYSRAGASGLVFARFAGGSTQTTQYLLTPTGKTHQIQYPDAHPNSRSLAFNAFGQLVGQTDQLGRQITIDLLQTGEKRAAVFDDQDAYEFVHDGLGRLVEASTNLASGETSTVEFIYDGHGRLIEERQTIGASTFTTKMSYNAAGQMTSLTYPCEQEPCDAVLNLEGRGTSLDGLGRPRKIDLNGAPLLDYSWEGTQIRDMDLYAAGAGALPFLQLESQYDEHARVEARTWIGRDGSTAATLESVQYAYDAGDYLTGMFSGLPGRSVVLDLDALGRVQKMRRGTHDGNGSLRPGSIVFEQDRTNPPGMDLLGNALHTLARAALPTGGFELIQLLAQSVSPANEILSLDRLLNGSLSESTNFVYDHVGNLIADGAQYYEYDGLNRLRRVQKLGTAVLGPDGAVESGELGPPLAAFTYDALGRRISQEIFPAAATRLPTGVTVGKVRYLYAGPRELETRDYATGDLRKRHFYTHESIDSRIRTDDHTGPEVQTVFYATDRLGSPTAAVAYDSTANRAAVLERYVYDLNGAITASVGERPCLTTDVNCDGMVNAVDLVLVRQAFGPAATGAAQDVCGIAGPGPDLQIDDSDLACVRTDVGKGPDPAGPPPSGVLPRPDRTVSLHGLTYDHATGLVYARARYFHPDLGRWMRRDPKGYVDGGNLYEAFRSNPLAYTDPMGEGVLTWLLVGDYGLSDRQFVKNGGLQAAAYGAGEGGANAVYNVGVGAVKTGRELAYTAADIAIAPVDIASTLIFHEPLGNPFSQVGQASSHADAEELGEIIGETGIRSVAGVVTLGASNVIEGTYNYYQTGDEEAFAQSVGGPAVLTLGTVGVVRAGTTVARTIAPSSGPQFKTWNQFQAGTKGQFASRAEAGAAWNVYKQANSINTGTIRSMAARGQYLKSLADDYRTPSWMKPWLEKGRVPPGYDVDHIKPLSIGGADTPANMRLQGADLHDIHHKFYRPWE